MTFLNLMHTFGQCESTESIQSSGKIECTIAPAVQTLPVVVDENDHVHPIDLRADALNEGLGQIPPLSAGILRIQRGEYATMCTGFLHVPTEYSRTESCRWSYCGGRLTSLILFTSPWTQTTIIVFLQKCKNTMIFHEFIPEEHVHSMSQQHESIGSIYLMFYWLFPPRYVIDVVYVLLVYSVEQPV